MEENRTEYAVEQKAEGKNLLFRILLVIGYVVFCGGGFLALAQTRIFIASFAMVPLLIYIIIFFTWRYVQVTHEYVIEVGEITFTEIYGNRTRKEVLRVPIKTIENVWSKDDRNEPEKTDLAYDFRSSAATPDAYFLTYKDEEERVVLVRFEATAKALRLLAMYNPSAVTKTRTTRY